MMNLKKKSRTTTMKTTNCLMRNYLKKTMSLANLTATSLKNNCPMKKERLTATDCLTKKTLLREPTMEPTTCRMSLKER